MEIDELVEVYEAVQLDSRVEDDRVVKINVDVNNMDVEVGCMLVTWHRSRGW